MTGDQIIQVTEVYEKVLRRVGTRPIEVDKDLVYPGVEKACKHALWMLPKIREFASIPESIAKAERWLCFVQGVMWNAGYFSINDMRDHNRSVEGKVGDELSEDKSETTASATGESD